MKIAFLIPQFPLLSETFILNQITSLIDRGHAVTIFASSPGNDPIHHGDIDKYNLLDHTVYFERTRDNVPKSKLLRILKAAVLVRKHFYKSPLTVIKSLNVFQFGKQAATLSLLYEATTFLDMGIAGYDIVHCHFGIKGNQGVLLKSLDVIKGKVLTTFYGYDISRTVKQRGEGVYNLLFKQGDAILAISERMKNQFIQMGCGKQKISVHRLGIDTENFRCSPYHTKDNCQVKLLTIARLVEKKGVEYGIRAAAKVIKTYPQIEYNIVGDGCLRSNLQSLINTLGLNDKIKLRGWKQQEEIYKILKESDILLAPSVTAEDGDEEGTPTVIIEALAQGLPVLSTYHSAIPELVQNGKSGFLIPERDVNGLTEKLTCLIVNQEMRARMGREGRNYVKNNHDIHKLCDQLEGIYSQLMAKNN